MAISKGMEKIGGYQAQAILFGKLQTVALNYTQIFAASAEMSIPSFAKRFAMLHAGRLDWFEALNTPYIRRRIEEMPPIIRQAIESNAGSMPNRLDQIAEMIGSAISISDGFFTAATYVMVLDERREAGASLGMTGERLESWARNETERIVDRLAQPVRKGARSTFENNANGAWRTLWNFASDARNKAQIAAYAIGKGNAEQRVGAAFYLFIGSSMFSVILKEWWRDVRSDDEDDDWDPGRMALEMVIDPLYGVPIFGAMAQDVVRAGFGEKTWDGTILDSGKNAIPSVKRLTRWDYDDDEIDRIVSDVNKIIGGFSIFSKNAANAKSITNIIEDGTKVIDNLIGN